MRRALVAAVTITMLVGAAVSASATWVRPPVGDLEDVSGVEAGCQVSIEAPVATEAPAGWKGSMAWFTVDSGLVCEDTWGAMKIRPRMWPIDAATDDRYTVWPLETIRPADESDVSFGGSTVFNPCLMKTDRQIHKPGTSDLRWALKLGAHTVIAGARGEVKSSHEDGHQYRGFAEQMYTVTCTNNRLRFR